MSFDENNFDTSEEAPLPEESNNNRTFLIAVGILGGIILISVACLVGVYLFGARTRATQQAQAASVTQTAQAANAFIDQALTATFEASILPTATEPPTATAVVNVATITLTPDPNVTQGVSAAALNGTPAAATATVAAALTQAAVAQLTIVPTSTLLPQTGIVEDVGVPGLVVMALAFIIVIMLARRLRTAPVR
ncbi:MAG TPA: hypothetical protein PKL78_02635 [Anaerolineales bacterium]|nr:hypothetical protein [Anaerolineales bacterium]HNN12426.1 hypothetical protein [Anaerolineales bacterium]HNO31087.1 hypothetical protein [Anaerolineales bacterium]